MIALLRFYRKTYNELFSGVTTEQEPESSTNTLEWAASLLNALFEITRIVQGPSVLHPWISCCIGQFAYFSLFFFVSL